MSIEKQKILNEIETLPDELANQVIDFIGYLKFLHISMEAPDIIADKYKILFKQNLKLLEDIAESMSVLDEN